MSLTDNNVPDSLPSSEPPTRPSISTVLIAIVVIAAIAASLYFLIHIPNAQRISERATIPVKMSPAEEAYLDSLGVQDLALSRAENFLHQEVTILGGTIVNKGAQTVDRLNLTIEFRDTMNQVVLRETRNVLGNPISPLTPGERRPFEISFEHVPNTWNQEQPVLRAAQLTLAASLSK